MPLDPHPSEWRLLEAEVELSHLRRWRPEDSAEVRAQVEIVDKLWSERWWHEQRAKAEVLSLILAMVLLGVGLFSLWMKAP